MKSVLNNFIMFFVLFASYSFDWIESCVGYFMVIIIEHVVFL